MARNLTEKEISELKLTPELVQVAYVEQGRLGAVGASPNVLAAIYLRAKLTNHPVNRSLAKRGPAAIQNILNPNSYLGCPSPWPDPIARLALAVGLDKAEIETVLEQAI